MASGQRKLGASDQANWVSVAPRLGQVSGFDTIRAVAVLLIVFHHARPEKTITFVALVDWFFVLSGFLITTLLLEEYRSTGSIGLRKFYARRSLRLLPNLYAVLLFCLVVVNLADVKDDEYRTVMREIWASAFYAYNLVFPFESTKEGIRPTGLILYHVWTLSLEQQFYILVGAVTLTALRMGWIRQLGAAFFAGALIIQVMRWNGHYGWNDILLQRPDALMIGVAFAVVNGHIRDPLPAWVRRWAPVVALGAAGIGLSTLLAGTWFAESLGFRIPIQPNMGGYQGEDHSYWIQWGFTVTQWSLILVLLPLFRVRDSFFARLLAVKPLPMIGGLLSYGIYVWHLPIQVLLNRVFFAGASSPFQLVAICVVPIGVGIASYFLIEKRALRLKARFAVISTPGPGESSPAGDLRSPHDPSGSNQST